jgi:hypothetical protein
MMTEFGATDDLPAIERVIENAERFMVSWQYWHYCQCDDPTTTGVGPTQALVLDPTKPPTGDNVKKEKLDVLARVHPEAVAGTPKRFGFDREERMFALDYSTARAGGGTLGPLTDTEIFVPARHYPDGYDVEVKGGEPVSAPGARILKVRACSGRREVQVRVKPGSGAATADCLAPVRGPGGGAVAKKPRLRLRVRPRRVRAGRLVRFRFRVFVSRPKRKLHVSGATIRFGGKRTHSREGGRGAIRKRFARKGRHRARVTKAGFKPGRAVVRVRPAR